MTELPLQPLVRDWRQQLEQAGVPSPAADVRQLCAFVLDCSLNDIALRSTLNQSAADQISTLVQRRGERIPLQHLTNQAAFLHLTLRVEPGVFIPRPETEVMTDHAVQLLRAMPAPRRVADWCAGSGAIGLALATSVPETQVQAVELSSEAVAVARHNGATVTFAEGSSWQVEQADVLRSQVGAAGSLDLVVANPPYIPVAAVPRDPEVAKHDPHLALYSGEDGLELIRNLVPLAFDLLRSGGWCLVEHADVQGDSVLDVFTRAGFVQVTVKPDLAGRPRFTVGLRA